ncbi:MAG: hypothetical protein V4697_04065 [Patescibacteria group bacterium]
MNKKYIPGIIGLIILIIASIYFTNKKTQVPVDIDTTVATTTVTVATSSIPAPAVKVSLLDATPYINNDFKFSLFLPKGWKQTASSPSTAPKSTTVFSNGSSTIVVKKFPRTLESAKAISFMGENEFKKFIADGLREEISGYQVIATSTVNIQGREYYKVIGSYTGKQSQKQVTQHVYVGLTEESYYVIGVDVYNELWAVNKDAISASLSTLKLL